MSSITALGVTLGRRIVLMPPASAPTSSDPRVSQNGTTAFMNRPHGGYANPPSASMRRRFLFPPQRQENWKRLGSTRKGRRTMAYDACLDRVPHDLILPDQPSRPRRSLWRRALDAMLTAQQRRADREIARFLATRGRITDDIEREIERRFLFNR